MDININVRAVDGTRTANTSADKQTTNKRSRAPMAKTKKAKKPGYMGITAKGIESSIAKIGIPLVAGAAIKIGAVRTMNSIEGTVTGNRFRQKVRGDIINSFARPFSTGARIVSTGFNQYFDVLREQERLTYQRNIAGFALPFRPGNSGITL